MVDIYISLALTIDGDGIVEPKYPTQSFPKTFTVLDVKKQIRAQFNIKPSAELIFRGSNGIIYEDNAMLANTGLANGDHISLLVKDDDAVSQYFGPNQAVEIPPGLRQLLYADPGSVIANLITEPNTLQRLMTSNPELAQAVYNNDLFAMQQWQFRERETWQRRIDAENARRAKLSTDPFSQDNQARIMEEIRQEQVMENYRQAMEYMPESFGRVVMLYIPMKIEGTSVHAFVDSGAQSTIISKTLAMKTGIYRLIDRRMASVAQGVGQARIYGKIHMVNVQFGKLHLPCSFTVMDDRMEFLFGLDMLRRYQAIMDLGKGTLSIQGEEVRFLSEGEIQNRKQQEKVEAGLVPSDKQKEREEKERKEAIANLTALGFQRKDVERAMESCRDDAELAASLLFSQNWNF